MQKFRSASLSLNDIASMTVYSSALEKRLGNWGDRVME